MTDEPNGRIYNLLREDLKNFDQKLDATKKEVTDLRLDTAKIKATLEYHVRPCPDLRALASEVGKHIKKHYDEEEKREDRWWDVFLRMLPAAVAGAVAAIGAIAAYIGLGGG
ncbi:MAG: hypothetical protein KKD77_20705 [Gammaproteobacteria bacterium]|nr:hypothetical protein [Gammaproteobacteria bacterium]